MPSADSKSGISTLQMLFYDLQFSKEAINAEKVTNASGSLENLKSFIFHGMPEFLSFVSSPICDKLIVSL